MLASVPPGQLWPVVAPLLSDANRGVRIRTAALLAAVPTTSQPGADRERFEHAAAKYDFWMNDVGGPWRELVGNAGLQRRRCHLGARAEIGPLAWDQRKMAPTITARAPVSPILSSIIRRMGEGLGAWGVHSTRHWTNSEP
jgi:hypothetical protein